MTGRWAVKICAEQFSERFEREAPTVAAVNRPRICTLLDVGPNYPVMEYIEGPNLGADRKLMAVKVKAGSSFQVGLPSRCLKLVSQSPPQDAP